MMRNFFKYPLWIARHGKVAYWGGILVWGVFGLVVDAAVGMPSIKPRGGSLRAGKYPAIFSKIRVAPASLLSQYVATRSTPLFPVKNLYFNSTDINIDVTNNLQGSRVSGSTIGTVTLNTPLPWKGNTP